MSKIYSYLLFSVLALSSIQALAQPANDNCSGAISIGTLPAPAACSGTSTQVGASTVLNNQTLTNATPSNPYPYQTSCAIGANFPNDVWYSFTPSAPQVTINITGAQFANPTVSVWLGACGNQIGQGCASGSGGSVSTTLYGLTVGSTYYLQVAGADGTQTGNFNLSMHNDNDCANCLVTTAVTISPPPVNGVYQPGQTVTFCMTITAWNTTNANWLHGVQPTFGSGWNLATLTGGTPPASIDGSGRWGFYPSGINSSASGSHWPAGFYYESTAGHGSLDANPGNNYGDLCNSAGGSNCVWTFCFTITTKTACIPGSDLSAVFNTSGDGESGVWTSVACTNDPAASVIARGSCCPPTMSSTSDLCSQGNGTATATPVGSNGPYTYQWSSGANPNQPGVAGSSTETGLSPGTITVTVTDVLNCSVTAQVNVTGVGGANAGPDRSVGCIALPGGTVTMAATGTGSWTAGTNPGTATIGSPSSPATSISNFSTVGTYTYIWNSSGCQDTARVTVGVPPNAGPDQTINCVILTGGSVTMAATNAGTWTALVNPGTSTIVTPSSPTTVINQFSAPGIYKYVWNTAGCFDTVEVTVNAASSAGPDRSVSCIILPGGTVTMAATGAGTWSAGAAPGTSSITTPSSPSTTITGFTAAGTYIFKWTNTTGCIDTALVVVTAKPDAGSDQGITCVTLPGGTVTMAAVGAGTWSIGAAPGTASITTPSSASTTITGFTAAGTYILKWTNASGCIDTALVTVTAAANAGADKAVSCATLPGGSATLVATGTGAWSAGTNPGAALIGTPAAASTIVSGFAVAGTYTYVWTNATGCKDTALIVVTAKPNAGPDQTVSCVALPGGTATMAATGTGTWTAGTNPGGATITTAANPTTTITGFTVAGIYTFVFTNADGCSDSAKVTVTALPNAGADKNVNCAVLTGGSTTMSAVGAGTWTAGSNPGTSNIVTPGSATTVINNFSAAGVYIFKYTNASGCIDTALVTVSARPVAGPNQTLACATLPGGTVTMAAIGTGTWTAGSNPGAATITTPTDPNTTITGFTAGGLYTFVWSNAAGCTSSMSVTVSPRSDGGPDQAVSCATLTGGTVTMAAVSPTGTWSAGSANPGTATIVSPSSPSTIIRNFTAAGTYIFRWGTTGCLDTVLIVVTAQPNAGADKNVTCAVLPGGSATMSAVGTGTWSAGTNPGSAVITTAGSPTTTITGFTAAGIYNFLWTNGTCVDSAAIVVTAKPDAGPDQSALCVVLPGGSVTMAGSGTGTWTALTNPGSATIATPTDPVTTITGFTAAGTYRFLWTNGTCKDTANIVVTAQPTAGPAQTVSCALLPGGTATMAGIGPGIWTAGANPGTSVITTVSSPTTTIKNFSVAGLYTYTLTNGACSSSTTVDVSAKPYAGPDQTTCRYTTATMAAVGAGTWSDIAATNPSTATIVNNTDPNTIISALDQVGVYRFIWTSGGCTDTVAVTVVGKPSAGADQNICQNATATMTATGTGLWTGLSTNPPGYNITNPTQGGSTLTGLSSVGIYSFVWAVNGCTDTVDIYVNPQPSVSITDTAVCTGYSATLTAQPSMIGGSYLWSTGDPTPSITITPAATSSFTVTYTLGICSAQAAGTVTIRSLPVVSVGTANSICTTANGQEWAIVTGSAPYTYAWNNPTADITDTISGLASGSNYAVIVTDTYGCTATAAGTVGLANPTIPILLVSQHNLRCNGDNSGNITINAVDSGSLTYVWTGASGTTTVSGLSPATYSVSVTDQFGCTGTAQYTITEPPVLTLAPLTYTDPICPGSADGTATATASGGSGAYHYEWDSSPAQYTQQATGLGDGTYNVTVTDDSGCVVSDNVDLIDPAATTFGPGSISDAHCHGAHDGTATVDPQGAFGPYQFLWSDPAHQGTAQATGLGASQYSVTVTDSRGCMVSTSVIIGEPTALTVAVSKTDLSCYQNNMGMAKAVAAGGTLPYHYLWSEGDTLPQITNLQASTYFITITDGQGCTVVGSTSLTEPPSMILVKASTGTTCAASVDGTITVSATGGISPMTYSLQDVTGNTIQTDGSGIFIGLGPAAFRVVATDANGCSASDTVSVSRAAFNVYTVTTDSTSCFGEQYKDGRIHVNGLTIPNAPFLYSVDGSAPQDIPDFYDLGAGPHTVHIKDAHGCDTSFIVIVGEPVPASVDILPGDTTIEVGATVQMTTAFRPYNNTAITSYAWSPADGLSCIYCPSPVATPYSAQSTYTVTVTYNQGCLAVTTVHINTAGDPPFFVPNAFSPNGDGENDVFYVYGEGIKTLKLTIFNRWGEKVFESDNQSQGWDGMYKGTLQEPGMYVYVVDVIYLNQHRRVKDGSITLIR